MVISLRTMTARLKACTAIPGAYLLAVFSTLIWLAGGGGWGAAVCLDLLTWPFRIFPPRELNSIVCWSLNTAILCGLTYALGYVFEKFQKKYRSPEIKLPWE